MHIVSFLDAFSQCGVDLGTALTLPLPLMDDLFKARLEYLSEKQKVQEEQMRKH